MNFVIISGPNAGLTGSGVTNAAGETTFTYTDAGPIPSFGTDRIRANIGSLQSNIAEMVYYAATGKHMPERPRGGDSQADLD